MNRTTLFMLLACGAVSGTIAVLYPGSFQEDGTVHYLQARDAFSYPSWFVGVWSRPLFMLFYAPVAWLGLAAAKLMTVALCLWAAWEARTLAAAFGWKRPDWVISILFLQPVFFQLSFDTLTEPVFAAVLIFALRLLHQGRKIPGFIALSFIPLARPEGGLALIAAAIWSRKDWKKIPFLAIGPLTWWLAALIITGNPLHILDDWPRNWKIDGPYGIGSPIGYLRYSLFIAGIMLPFVFMAKDRPYLMYIAAGAWVFYFATWMTGAVGGAGHIRFMGTVAPVTALVTLAGFNRLPEKWVPRLAPVLLVLGLCVNTIWVDSHQGAHDATVMRTLPLKYEDAPRMQFSHSYGYVITGRDFGTYHFKFNEVPDGTIAVWDDEAGPNLFGLTFEDFEKHGWTRLDRWEREHHKLFLTRLIPHYGKPRRMVFEAWKK